jgi:hypothetical protein
MPPVPPDAELKPGQHPMPVLWFVSAQPLWQAADITSQQLVPPDAEVERFLPPGKSRKLRSFGHDEEGVHWLLTRGGTILHTDPAYARYSHQLILRNDGNRLRGLRDEEPWHPPMVPGTFYALDTHSPHQGTPDTRLLSPHMAGAGPPILKLVIAVDRDELLPPERAWSLLSRLLGKPLPAIGQTTHSAPRHWTSA